MSWIAVVVAAYALGAVPAGYLLVRILRGSDVRTEGSGNIGATNVLRTTGTLAGLATLLFDVAKGALAVLLAQWIRPDAAGLAGAVATLAVVGGHVFPPTLRFRGGKGVASAAGAYFVTSPLLCLVSLAVLAAAVAVTRWVSLGSILFASIFPVAVLVRDGPWPAFPFLLATSVLVVARHAGNIPRLIRGTEPRLGAR